MCRIGKENVKEQGKYNIVKVDEDLIPGETLHKWIKGPLEGGWGIPQAKGHTKEFKNHLNRQRQFSQSLQILSSQKPERKSRRA